MANTLTFLHGGFPWVPVDFNADLFYVLTNNYCFVQVSNADTMIFLHEGFPLVPVDFKVDYFTNTLITIALYEFLQLIRKLF